MPAAENISLPSFSMVKLLKRSMIPISLEGEVTNEIAVLLYVVTEKFNTERDILENCPCTCKA